MSMRAHTHTYTHTHKYQHARTRAHVCWCFHLSVCASNLSSAVWCGNVRLCVYGSVRTCVGVRVLPVDRVTAPVCQCTLVRRPCSGRPCSGTFMPRTPSSHQQGTLQQLPPCPWGPPLPVEGPASTSARLLLSVQPVLAQTACAAHYGPASTSALLLPPSLLLASAQAARTIRRGPARMRALPPSPPRAALPLTAAQQAAPPRRRCTWPGRAPRLQTRPAALLMPLHVRLPSALPMLGQDPGRRVGPHARALQVMPAVSAAWPGRTPLLSSLRLSTGQTFPGRPAALSTRAQQRSAPALSCRCEQQVLLLACVCNERERMCLCARVRVCVCVCACVCMCV